MSIKNKQYKRLSEVSEEERKIIAQILSEIGDIKLISTEFNILMSDLEELAKTPSEKAKLQTVDIKEVEEIKREKAEKEETKKREAERKEPERIKTEIKENARREPVHRPNSQKQVTKQTKSDYRMRTIRNKYYYLYNKTKFNFQNPIKRKMTPEDERELIALLNAVKKGVISSKVVRKLDEKIELLEDVERLEEINKVLHARKEKYDFRVESIKSKVSTRISNLKMQNSIDKMVNFISDDIKSVILGIVSGTIDINDAKEKIDNETHRKLNGVQNKSNMFAMTEKQARKQVFMQIRRILIDRADEFTIAEPIKSINVLTELTGKDEQYLNISAVVSNLKARKEYGVAKAVCANFSKVNPYVFSLEREIIGIEIGEIVLNQIRKNATLEEDTMFMNLLEERIRRNGVPKKLIGLGSSKDGGKKITLEDIWYDNRVK